MPYKDPQKKKEKAHFYYQNNKTRFREWQRKWRKKNPEKVRIIQAKCRNVYIDCKRCGKLLKRSITGFCRPCWQIGNKYNLGKIRTKKSREKASKTHIRIRKEHPNWKGGISPQNKTIRAGIEFRLWREAVFARDNWTCQKYKIRGGKLHPHHILNFAEHPDLRFAIDNGITLSEKAHTEFHKQYGNRKNTREQLNDFLL